MSLAHIETWVEELKKRGIKTFEHKDLPESLRDRTMIIKAKYAGVIRKCKIAMKGSRHTVWEIT